MSYGYAIWPNTPERLEGARDFRNVGPGDLVEELADRATAWAAHPSYGHSQAQLQAFHDRVRGRLFDALYHTDVPGDAA